MNPYYREKLRGILEAEIEATRLDIERLEPLCAPVPPDKGLGRITRMEVLNDLARNEAVLEKQRDRLEDMEEAFSRIDEKGFGMCMICGEEIGFERLKILPDTRLCVRCA